MGAVAQHGELLQGLRRDHQDQALPQALRRDVPGVQRLHHDRVVPVVRDHLLRVRRRPGDGGQVLAGYNGTLGAISTFGVIFIVTWLATQIGKRKAFYFSTGMSILGFGLKWFCYDPERPWLVMLPAPLIAFGLGGLFTLMGSMIADVVDEDELTSNQRREGMFGSIFWWVVKVGMAAALAAGGFLLNATGFDVALGGAQTERTLFLLRVFDVVMPMITSAIAIYMIASYPITEERAHTRASNSSAAGVAKAAAAARSDEHEGSRDRESRLPSCLRGRSRYAYAAHDRGKAATTLPYSPSSVAAK
jgi:hypothetical protein